MPREDIEALAKRFVERRFDKGQIVFNKGDQGSSIFIIRSGAVQIFLPPAAGSPRVVLTELREGAHFGELSLFDGKPRSASVEAQTETLLLELMRDAFADHLHASKAATLAILGELAERLRETNAMLSQRAAKDAVRAFEENLPLSQRLADKVADLNGSWLFIGFLVIFTSVWMALNAFLPAPFAFDEYPYQFYNLALAVLVALQGPLIVMSQNRQQGKERAQAEADFRVNLKNEVGIETLLREQSALMRELETLRTEVGASLGARESEIAVSKRSPEAHRPPPMT
jgi:uncharacterized membrane protein